MLKILKIVAKMHPDLSSHLHTSECNDLIKALVRCHEEKKYGRFFFGCNAEDTAMSRCLKQELENRRRENNKRAKEDRELRWKRMEEQKEKSEVSQS